MNPTTLANLKVLDLSRLFPGPYATQMLADLGADVVKVEPPGEGDYMRFMEPCVEGESTFFANLNRNKKSLCLDLKNPEGRAVLLKLAETADVLVESFRPGVMERLGVGYDALSAVNPRLVYCAITGYGSTGPLANAAGHDLNYIAVAGILSQLKDREGDPIVPGIQIADVGGGALHGVIGILAALAGRAATGRGQRIDVSMADALAPWLVYPWSMWQAGWKGRETGAIAGRFPCYQVYRCHDGKHIALAALEPKFWKSFCERVGKPEWTADQFADEPLRSELFGEMRALFLTRTRDDWSAFLAPADCCATPVLELEELPDNPHWKAKNLVIADAPGACAPGALAPAMGVSDGFKVKPPPKLGGDTREVMSAYGFGAEEIEGLISKGAVL
jgi:crotonobetainyl-CoA:carnitine CoA-transferase CaiB-like acyl-CoA transferase